MGDRFTPIPEIDLDEVERDIRKNREERLKFVRMYAEWLMKQPNKVWSGQQKKVVNTSTRSDDSQ